MISTGITRLYSMFRSKTGFIKRKTAVLPSNIDSVSAPSILAALMSDHFVFQFTPGSVVVAYEDDRLVEPERKPTVIFHYANQSYATFSRIDPYLEIRINMEIVPNTLLIWL